MDPLKFKFKGLSGLQALAANEGSDVVVGRPRGVSDPVPVFSVLGENLLHKNQNKMRNSNGEGPEEVKTQVD